MKKSIEDQISFLKKCAKEYEHNGTSSISDGEYDILYAEAKKLDPDNPFFDNVGGEVEGVIGEKVKHDITMGSLSKCLNISPDFEKWLKTNFDEKDNPQFLLSHKLDGLSLSLVYKNGTLIQSLTRGDGSFGVNVLANCQYIKDIPKTIPCKDEVEIRGEVFKNRDSFKEWKAKGYANERNFAAGSLNQPKDPSETGRRELSFTAYIVLRKEGFKTHREKVDFLEQNGFKTLKSVSKTTKAGLSLSQIIKAVESYMNSIKRKDLNYLIDGIVVKLCDLETAEEMGFVGKKPKSDIAIKYPSQVAETVITGIEVNVGRSGKLCPVGILKEIEIDGSKISRVTLHNFGMITGNDALKIGARVTIARKSDIIPQIVSVLENTGKSFVIPTKCPICGEQVKWTNSGVDLICDNFNCLGQLNKKIEFFLKGVGIENIGQGIISKLTEDLEWEGRPIISSLPEMFYKLDNDRDKETKHPFQKYAYLKENLGEKTYDNILENIKKIKEVDLATFISALGFSHVSTSAKDIADVAKTIEGVDKLTVDDLLKIENFGDVKANSFVSQWKSRRKEIETMLEYISITITKNKSDKLVGKSFCFTGSFNSPTRGEMEK
ncbi:MAG: NAD-dependent DNA ligase LigA, partial [bacterium]|nr:NAD-dependent DNA ligase LigA [bacterium]